MLNGSDSFFIFLLRETNGPDECRYIRLLAEPWTRKIRK